MNNTLKEIENIKTLSIPINNKVLDFYNDIISKEDIQRLQPKDFPFNLSQEQVEDYFLKALETRNFDLVDYLLNTDKNNTRPILRNNEKLINLLNTIYRGASQINKDLIFQYILNKKEFIEEEVLSYDLARQVIQSAINDNYMPIIKLTVHEPQFLEHFQTGKCFAKACEYGNIDLLNIYFNEEEKYFLGTKDINMRWCVTESIKNKQYDTLFYLFNVKHIHITPMIEVLCNANEQAKEMLRDYRLYSALEDKINVLDTKKKIKRKL